MTESAELEQQDQGRSSAIIADRPSGPTEAQSPAGGAITPDAAIAFLTEAARYFESRPTYGEDAAIWSNVYNAENCRKIAALLATRGGA